MPRFWTLLAAGLLGAAVLYGADTARKPNIILIMADDLGYETIAANGGESYQTPVLDKLAAQGTRFAHCYAQPLCTPTRVQLMTGQYNVRNYVKFDYLDPRSTTFGTLLKNAGYATCIVGKWQLGREKDFPRRCGFDEAYLWQHTRRPPRYANPGLELNGEEQNFTNGEYGPDLLNNYALDFIARKKNEPFFLYYPLTLTHDPYQPTPLSAAWDPKAMGERANIHPRHFADMVNYMDRLIGKLVEAVAAQGLSENTLILFVGDNGTGHGIQSKMNGVTVAGGKGRTLHTGMRVPLIAYGPGRIDAGKVCNDLIDSTDFLPTLLDAAGVKAPPELKLDGRSFLPQLRGETGSPREWVYSWYSPRQGPEYAMQVREFAFDREYKLYRGGQFFDLKNDLDEKSALKVADLKGDAAAAAARLQAALDRYKDARPAELDEHVQALRAKPGKKAEK